MTARASRNKYSRAWSRRTFRGIMASARALYEEATILGKETIVIAKKDYDEVVIQAQTRARSKEEFEEIRNKAFADYKETLVRAKRSIAHFKRAYEEIENQAWWAFGGPEVLGTR